MNLEAKKWIVAILSLFFLASLLIVAWIEGGGNGSWTHRMRWSPPRTRTA